MAWPRTNFSISSASLASSSDMWGLFLLGHPLRGVVRHFPLLPHPRAGQPCVLKSRNALIILNHVVANSSKPDVLLARSTLSVRALLAETRTIPIVFVSLSDPVGENFAASLARPGGNVTGFTNVEATMAGKWLELLKEIAPRSAGWGFCSIRGQRPQAAPVLSSYPRSRPPLQPSRSL